SFMPSDRLRDDDRWGYALLHDQTLTDALNRLGAGGRAGLNLNLNRDSDDNYWRDYPRAHATLTQRLLPSNAQLDWTRGPWSLVAGAYTWQTLQDIESPITPPYDRVPAVSLAYQRTLLDNWRTGETTFQLRTDFTRFESDPGLTGQPNGERTMAIAQIGHRW